MGADITVIPINSLLTSISLPLALTRALWTNLQIKHC